MSYTQNLEDALFELMGETDEDYTEEQIIEFLNNEDMFRDFGQGLAYLTRKYMPEGSIDTEEEFLKKAAKDKNISLNRNTVKSWFQGIRPKKGEQSRLHMYKICFALGLSIEDVVYLFKNIYFDKPFNLRNYEEFIYFYCLKNGYTIDRANSLIERIKDNETGESSEGTIYTEFIGRAVKEMNDDDEVIEYIVSHPHNFSINNRSAGVELYRLINEIRPTKEEEDIWKNAGKEASKKDKNEQIRIKDNNRSYLIREIALTKYEPKVKNNDKYLVQDNKSVTAIETMLDIITGHVRGNAPDNSGKSIFKDSTLPKEITNRFPIKKSFSTNVDDLPSEEIRKMIVLLFSYKYWFNMQYLENAEASLEDYKDTLDVLLVKCSLQTMYYGNPFDWLFLYCTLQDNPLDCFRNIISEGGGAWS